MKYYITKISGKTIYLWASIAQKNSSMHSAKPSTFHETRKNSRLFVYRRKLQKINEWTRLKLNFTFAFYLHFDSITIFKTKPFLYKITLLTNKFPCHDISEGAVCTFNMDVLKHPKTKFKWNHNVGTSGTYICTSWNNRFF